MKIGEISPILLLYESSENLFLKDFFSEILNPEEILN